MGDLDLFIIEDNRSLCESLHESFKDRGFRVASARTVAEARTKMTEYGDIAVALLDMMLDVKGITGADLGFEMRRRFVPPPEFLIHTSYSSNDYYQKSHELGAAGYLKKGNIPKVIAHVRCLRLKRELNTLDPEIFHNIIGSSRTINDALIHFCHQILLPLFQKYMGNRIFFLINDATGTKCLRTDRAELLLSPLYAQLYRTIPSQHLRPEGNIHTVQNHAQKEFRGAVLLPFWDHEQIKMVIGVFRDGRGPSHLFPDHPKTLVSTFRADFFNNALREVLSRISTLYTRQHSDD